MSNDRPDINVVTSETMMDMFKAPEAAKTEPQEGAAVITDPTNPAEETQELEEQDVETADPEEAEGTGEPEDKEPETRKPKQKGIQKRMQELTERAKYAEEAARQAREDAIKERQAREDLERRIQQPRPNPNKAPEMSDFKTTEEYYNALTDYKVNQALQERETQERTKQVQKNWNSALDNARNAHEDYDDVVASAEANVSDEVRDAIIESEQGPELVYFLASNPDVVERLNGLSPRNAIKELGRIEARLEKAQSKEEPKPKAQLKAEVSKAPAPIKPISAKTATESSMSATQDWPADKSPAEYRAMRMAGKIK